MFKFLLPLAGLIVFSLTSITQAEEGVEGGSEIKYIHLTPAFVVNYGNTGRMKYLRTEIALKVYGALAAGAVTSHRPYIRNNLVFLLTAQDGDIVNSSTGREKLRKVALDEVRALMSELEGQPMVDDLYFENFVVQN
ncbi:MAG TPA: flagellar basal body-associated protein FliL [Oceanospirillales bacterium]|nr:flagellar basal body-associated protein FliL [Oleispira sp.]HCM04695.1 flagellar basal body-associated protein FliL [Oceanospirillales bacterium]|tara:strand:- start:2853 stop:3263 length:411 start_codon:yes stop_codon:yes gene_type:complete